MPDLAQADGNTKPEPVSAYVVIIERNDAAIFKINFLWILFLFLIFKLVYTLIFFNQSFSNDKCCI